MFAAILGCALLAGIAIAISFGYIRYTCKVKRKDQMPMALSYSVALIAIAFGLGPGSFGITHHAVQQGAVGGYHQFLNGSVVSTNMTLYHCTEDGSCTHEYPCDPYTTESYDPYTGTDGKTHYHWVTHHHHHECPYVTNEYSYTLTVSYGFETQQVDIASHIFTANPKRWRDDADMGDVSNVYRGVPPQWQKAHNDLAAGNTDPVTTTGTYKNYILSSESTILKAHSDDIAQLKKLGLLPPPSTNLQDPIYNDYLADKVSFIKFAPADSTSWQDALMHFNAALGIMKQGDMHIIAVRASAIPASISPEDYLNAVKADWLGNLGKYAIAKNTIVLVLGVSDDGSTIQWSRAATGMPIGNGSMLEALGTNLANMPFTVDAVLGNTTGRVVDPNGKQPVSYQIGSGKAAQIVMQEFPFERACMGCTSKADKAKGGQGFVYLSTEIPVSKKAYTVMFIIDALLVSGAAYLGTGMLAGGMAFKGQGDDEFDPYDTSSKRRPGRFDMYA